MVVGIEISIPHTNVYFLLYVYNYLVSLITSATKRTFCLCRIARFTRRVAVFLPISDRTTRSKEALSLTVVLSCFGSSFCPCKCKGIKHKCRWDKSLCSKIFFHGLHSHCNNTSIISARMGDLGFGKSVANRSVVSLTYTKPSVSLYTCT